MMKEKGSRMRMRKDGWSTNIFQFPSVCFGCLSIIIIFPTDFTALFADNLLFLSLFSPFYYAPLYQLRCIHPSSASSRCARVYGVILEEEGDDDVFTRER